MAALQKFKLLATQCGVSQSPTRSPRTSPVVHLRRKTTLRMLLTRRSPRRREMPLPPSRIAAADKRKDVDAQIGGSVGRSLRDLFVSSPPFDGAVAAKEKTRFKSEAFAPAGSGGGLRIGPGSPRPGWIGFRNRSLLRKVWRPVLIAIAE